MGRNIVVFADGTGNSAAKAFKTNVWRLYQALDLTGGDQLAVFSDGVGTSQFKPFEIIGLALGFGVKRRVLALYKFLCLNHQDGDRIFAFGFSRGAFTIRVLVGMIAREGLVLSNSEEELDRNARAAYRAYRPKAFPAHRQPWVVFARYIAAQWFDFWNQITYDQVKPKGDDPRAPRHIQIAFVGVWDTVAAYGLPVDELTRAVDKWVWPITFERPILLEPVQCARQAFSIDDERRTFFPIPWEEMIPAKKADAEAGDEASTAGDKKVRDPRVKQVWFAGTHSNVGGGYADDRLAHVPLCWMIGEAAEQGLNFKKEVVADYWDYASEAGRIYDSRSGFNVLYRYHPRPVNLLMGDNVKPLVDASVITRMAKGADDYAPVSLLEHIDVLTPLGARIAFSGEPASAAVPIGPNIVDKLPLPDDRKRDLVAMDQKFHNALGLLQKNNIAASVLHIGSRAQRMQLMLDTVWWRRVIYYALLSIAVIFLSFPLFAGHISQLFDGYADTYDINYPSGSLIQLIINSIIGVARGFLPGIASPWVDAVEKEYITATILAVLLAVLLWINGVLRICINDRARSAWNVDRGQSAGVPLSDRNDAHRRSALIGAVFLGFCALATGRPWEHIFQFGWKSIAGTDWIAWVGLFLGVASLGCLAAYLFLSARGPRAASTPVSLVFARTIRTNHGAQQLYTVLREKWLPAAFLALSAYLVWNVADKAVFEVADSMGTFCKDPALANRTGAERVTGAASDFKTNEMCSDTGNWLQEGVRYEVEISINKDDKWFDRTLCADTLGVRDGSVAHYFATLQKRWWAEPYFKPIARIGRYGNDEYVLNSVDPAATSTCMNDKLRAEIKPKTSGELYIYVNDAVLALPSLTNIYYQKTDEHGIEINNRGSAKITVSRVNVFP